MAASRGVRSRGPLCSGFWRQSARGSSMWWWSTRSTGSPARSLTSPSSSRSSMPTGSRSSRSPSPSTPRPAWGGLPSTCSCPSPSSSEVTGERIRDKLAASKRRGIWVGGIVPLGYEVRDRKLVVREDEAQIIRLIFERYLALGSLPALQCELRERGILTRLRTMSSGRTIGGVPLTNGPLAHLLRNRVYVGELNHKGASHPGEHAPILPPALFDAVQET